MLAIFRTFSLGNAYELVRLCGEKESPKYERAAMRGMRHLQMQSYRLVFGVGD